MNQNKAMCTYCAKWFPADEMKLLPDDPNNVYPYCPKCFPEVLTAHRNLPWNKKRGLH
jgi:hypothetical protein